MGKNKTTILIIDDDQDFLDAVSSILESAHYNVATALDPKDGMEKLVSENPDLVLLDIMMDSLFDGFSLCHSIKTSKEFSQTPVILVSAVKEQTGSRFNFKSEDQGMMGPDDYLDKPIKPDNLLRHIGKLLLRENFQGKKTDRI